MIFLFHIHLTFVFQNFADAFGGADRAEQFGIKISQTGDGAADDGCVRNKSDQLPGGDAGAYAVTVDGGGMVWVNEINLDTVVRFDPKTEQMRVVQLPSNNVGIRKMVTDARGRLWYMGSHNGRLGVVE